MKESRLGSCSSSRKPGFWFPRRTLFGSSLIKPACLRPGTVQVYGCMNAGFREHPFSAARCIEATRHLLFCWLAGWQAVRSLPKVVPHGIACAHSSGHINGSVVDLGLSNNRDAIRSRIGGAGRKWRGWGGTLVPDEPGRFSTDSHQPHHLTHLHHRWCGWVVDHCGALSAGGSFLRSRNSAFCLGG